jgi:hypothetical protein
MSLFTTPNLSSLGSINVPAFLFVPPLLNFAAEWAALIPLVCHLASYHHLHQLAGQVALLGRVSIALFPKHGVLAGISRLLSRGPEFLDMASTLSPASRRAWYVKWGGSFPCANGAASSSLAESLLKDCPTPIKAPEPVLSIQSTRSSAETTSLDIALPMRPSHPGMGSTVGDQCAISASKLPQVPLFHRYQTLHVSHFSKTACRASWPLKLDTFLFSTIVTTATLISKVGLEIVLILFGMYGTAIILLCNSITQLVSRRVIDS